MEYDVPNFTTFDAMGKCKQVLSEHNKILLSYSGGSDSDIMLDLVQRVIKEINWQGEIRYVWFDTGIEYSATKTHILDVEKKYNIKIERVRAKVPVPLGCKKYGLPFISKDISAKINVLQNNNFDFKNDGNLDFEHLIKKYNGKCVSVFKWWCNKKSSHNIKDNLLLKEFLIENPPTFRISERCCEGAKKKPSNAYEIENNIDLKCLGLRLNEGGVRATKIENCFTPKEKKNKHNTFDDYRPIWWFSDKDKQQYKDYYNIKFSDCYEVYGFKRTGCCGCPFNSMFEEDLDKIKNKEPLLYQAVNNIFGASYEYTRKYREFKKLKKDGIVDGQQDLFYLLKGETK